MTDVRKIVENTLVQHEAFEAAKHAVNQCYSYAERAAEPICIAVIGESRTGKTRVQEECITAHPPERDGAGIRSPILRVKTPSRPTVKGLAEVLLRALQDPSPNSITENAMTGRVMKLLYKCQTRMVILDEFQHFYDKDAHKVMYHVADWLKVLADDARVALVVSGLPTCRAVIEQNEQLAGRFLAPITMPRFDWNIEKHRQEFTEIIGTFGESLQQHFDLPTLDEEEMAFRCYCGTGGLVGYIAKFLRQAVWNAVDSGSNVITLADLQVAHERSVWKGAALSAVVRPFAANFDPNPTPALLEKVMCIGAAVEPPPKPTRARSTKPMKMTAQSAASAS